MIKAGILGATGYTARVLIELLVRHPQAEITGLTSRREEPVNVFEIHPALAGQLSMNIEPLSANELAERCDCIFSCLPHSASAMAWQAVDVSKTAIVDFSADYRLWDHSIYQDWYGQHPCPDGIGRAAVPYGLPELFRGEIVGSRCVANPGCYPTAAILAVAPLLRRNLVEPHGIILDAKSGVTGAGRTPSLATLFSECNESVAAYKVGAHRHQPEITQILGTAADDPVDVVFTPHLIPMDRGILMTSYTTLRQAMSTDEVLTQYRAEYENEPFVQVVDGLPATKHVVGSNSCFIGARVVNNRLITVSCIDNLLKGASGAAVQNMNLMFGLPETMGLTN